MRLWQQHLLNSDERYMMRVLNKKYWPHQHETINWMEAEKWCYENFKSANWRNVGKTFAFKHGQDSTLFALRWL
jgi:hypothetical protein